MEIKPTVMVIADISGYTNFTRLHRFSLMHAEKIITELLEVILESTEHPLEVYRLAGDAVFFYSTAESPEALAEVVKSAVRQASQFFDIFRNREVEIVNCDACICEACAEAGKLRLKVFIHAGDVLFKKIGDFNELAGEDVILIHRLMKNKVKSDEYMLLTESVHQHLETLPEWPVKKHHEVIDDMDSYDVTVLFPYGEAPRPTPSKGKASLLAVVRQSLRYDSYAIGRLLGLVKQKREFSNLPGAQ